MTYTRRQVRAPERPVLVVALEGWVDPGFAAAAALASLLEQFDNRTFAVFDTDELIDLRARRPRVRIDDGVRGRIYWPGPRLRVGTDNAGKGVAFLVGPEPDFRWRPFATEVAELAVELGTELIVGLGAFPAPTPHTRPVAVTATASDQALARRIGFMPGTRDRPARMIDVIGSFCMDAGIPSIGLSARVPHYVGQMPYPPASIALLEALGRVSGLSIETDNLQESAESTRVQLDEMIAQSEEHIAMVRQLEDQYEEIGTSIVIENEIPSGDEIAAELERYLRGEMQ